MVGTCSTNPHCANRGILLAYVVYSEAKAIKLGNFYFLVKWPSKLRQGHPSRFASQSSKLAKGNAHGNFGLEAT